MVIFFTLPPSGVPWPWVLVNQFNIDTTSRYIVWTGSKGRFEIRTDSLGWRYLTENIKYVELVLLDSGVEKLFKRQNPPTDYPPEYERLWWSNVQRLTRILGKDRVWVTIPDYPDDYVEVWGKPHALWVDGKDNIERTVENIVHYWDRYCTRYELRCVVPIQGHYEAPESIRRSIKMLSDYGILMEAEILGIANLCTTRKATVIVKTVRIARALLPDKWLHVFGPSLRAVRELITHVNSFDSAVPRSFSWLWLSTTGIPIEEAKKMRRTDIAIQWFVQYIRKLIGIANSFDTTAHTFPRKAHGWSCKSVDECVQYFIDYLKTFVEHRPRALKTLYDYKR